MFLEMSGPAKPLTSFLIEDILSRKDSTTLDGKCCSMKVDRCSQWGEESEKISAQSFSQESMLGMQTGELLLLNTARM